MSRFYTKSEVDADCNETDLKSAIPGSEFSLKVIDPVYAEDLVKKLLDSFRFHRLPICAIKFICEFTPDVFSVSYYYSTAFGFKSNCVAVNANMDLMPWTPELYAITTEMPDA